MWFGFFFLKDWGVPAGVEPPWKGCLNCDSVEGTAELEPALGLFDLFFIIISFFHLGIILGFQKIFRHGTESCCMLSPSVHVGNSLLFYSH